MLKSGRGTDFNKEKGKWFSLHLFFVLTQGPQGKEKNQLRNPKTKFSAQRTFIWPRGTEGRDKGQSQRIKGRGRREREPGKGGRGICPRGTKDCFWIEKRQTWHIGNGVDKGKKENPVLG